MKKYFILFFAALLGVVACEKNDVVNSVDTASINDIASRSSEISVDGARNAFAKTLLLSLETEPELLSFIYSSIQKMDTSMYECVYIAEKDRVIVNGKTFAEILQSHSSNEYGSSFFINEIVEIDPMLSISMPDLESLEISDWKPNVIPDIAVVNDEEANFLLYSSSSSVPENIEPSGTLDGVLANPTLAIIDAEGYYLIDANGELIDGGDLVNFIPESGDEEIDHSIKSNLIAELSQNSSTLFQVHNKSYRLIEHNQLLEKFVISEGADAFWIEPPTHTNTTVTVRGCEEPCERDCEIRDEHLRNFKINGWGVFENIRNQPFETKYVFHAHIMSGHVVNGQITPMETKYVSQSYKKKHLLDCKPHPCSGRVKFAGFRWWTDWKEDEIASPVMVQWFEVDNTKTTVSLNFPLTVKFKVAGLETSAGLNFGIKVQGEKTVDLGNQRVFYCDPVNMEHNTGSITFQLD